MTREQAQFLADTLLTNFPWLITDEPCSGADTVDAIAALYQLARLVSV
jgi:hypothetical protein